MLKHKQTKHGIRKEFSVSGQTAVEYLLLLGVVVAIVLIGFKTYLPRTQGAANLYWNRVNKGILGDPNPCGDGICASPWEDSVKCPVDCGPAPTSN